MKNSHFDFASRIFLFFFAASFSLINAGCVDSPLLHHADAAPSESRIREPQTEACPFTFPKAGLCANLTWTKMPTDSEKGSFVLRFWNVKLGSANGPYSTPTSSVFAKLWMPDMGHGSSPVTTAPAMDANGAVLAGIYNTTDVFFVMGGTWEIWVQLREGTEVIDQAKISISIE